MKKYAAPSIEFEEILSNTSIANDYDIDLIDDDEIGIEPDVSGWGGLGLD